MLLAYDRTFTPPAPVADVTITHPVTGARSGVLRGKLDSGADVTVIPERLVAPLGLTPQRRIWLRSYDGTYAQRPVYYLRLNVVGFDLAAVRCVTTDRANVLLGRNVLNRFVIILDGKNLCFELQDP
ncbi:MAG: retroviral-like aspartic protease family protein [Candidatus Binatia bacterium]